MLRLFACVHDCLSVCACVSCLCWHVFMHACVVTFLLPFSVLVVVCVFLTLLLVRHADAMRCDATMTEKQTLHAHTANMHAKTAHDTCQHATAFHCTHATLTPMQMQQHMHDYKQHCGTCLHAQSKKGACVRAIPMRCVLPRFNPAADKIRV